MHTHTHSKSPSVQLTIFLLTALLASAAQDSTLSKLISETSDKIGRELAGEFTEQSYAAEQKIAYPIPSPLRTPKEIFILSREEASQKLQDEDPPLSLDILAKEAVQQYPLYRKGDRVVLSTRPPRNSRIEGIINNINKDIIIVGSRWVRQKDLDEQFRIALDPEETARLRKAYIQKQFVLHQQKRKQSLAAEIMRIFPEKMIAGGYIRKKIEADSPGKGMFDSSAWLTRMEEFQEKYQEKFQKIQKQRTEKELQKILPQKGYCRDARTGNWRKMTFLEKIKYKFR